MAKLEDYLPGGKNDPNASGDGLEQEIEQASNAQDERVEQAGQADLTAPGDVDWEQRYKELEKLNSRQAQNLGTYRKLVDEFIANPTSKEEAASEEPPKPITLDDLYDDPDKAVARAVESHPAIKEAKKATEMAQKREYEQALSQFMERHPEASTLVTDPSFRNWVESDNVRVDLYTRADTGYDLSAADALFSLYKAETQLTQATKQQNDRRAVEQATLEESSNMVVPDTPKYSRSEYVDNYMKAKQGDLTAERWVKRNAEGYRRALQSGNVRD